MECIWHHANSIGVNISKPKSGTKRTEKREKLESKQAQLYDETTVVPTHDEMHTKATWSIFFTTGVGNWCRCMSYRCYTNLAPAKNAQDKPGYL